MYAYNPRKKSAEQLESSLVGADRHDILSGILSELALKDGESPKQHWMIVGARGMGKSHLLTLLHHKVCGDTELCKLWIPVLFPEEIRMAGDLAKFLERAATEILHDLERIKSAVASDLKEKISRTRSIRHDERVDYLFSVITWIRKESGRHILLIAENLQQLLGKKISLIDQKKLRAYLQTEDALLLIGSATTIFDALHDHSHPFYHFFHIRRLGELSFEDVKKLVTNLLSGYGKEEQSRIMLENEARLKVLHSFTGGNPRMAVFLSDILKTDVNEEMIDIMDRILDELTPYFEAIINDTPEYLQGIINALAAYEPAQSPKEIADHLEMEQATVRNYLKQAKDNGYVRIAFSKGKSNFYCLNEYLYRTWFQMRDSSHREEMRWLMELMLLLYTREQIMEENRRIDEADGGCANHYQRLIKQTFDFMLSNPSFCKVIDLCAQQVEEKRGKVNLKFLKINKAEVSKRFKQLNSCSLTRREYNAGATNILVDVLKKLGDESLASLLSYSFAIPNYFMNALDIVTAVKEYGNHIIPNKEKYRNQITSIIDSSEQNPETLEFIILNSVSIEYFSATRKVAIFLSENGNKIVINNCIILLSIQIIYYCHVNEIEKAICSIYAMQDICEASKYNNWSVRLFFYLVLAHRKAVVEDEAVKKLFKNLEVMGADTLLFDLWRCIFEPSSEAAQRMLAEPEMKALVTKINRAINKPDEQQNE